MRKWFMLFAAALCLALAAGGGALAATKLVLTPAPPDIFAGGVLSVSVDLDGVTPEGPPRWRGRMKLVDNTLMSFPDDFKTEPDMRAIIQNQGDLPWQFKVTLPKPGRLELWCDFSDANIPGEIYTPEITVDVTPVPAAAVNFGPKDVSPDQWASMDLTVKVGKALNLAAALWPLDTEDKIVSASWKTSSEDIATVSNGGTLTGKGPGTAQITVTVTTDRETNGNPAKYTATRAVTVTGVPAPVAGKIIVARTKVDGKDALWVDWSNENEAVDRFDLVAEHVVATPVASSKERPARLPIADIPRFHDGTTVLVRCVGQDQRTILGELAVDLNDFNKLPDPPVKDVTFKIGGGSAIFSGQDVRKGTGDGDLSYLWLPDDGKATLTITGADGAQVNVAAADSFFIPEGFVELKKLVALINDIKTGNLDNESVLDLTRKLSLLAITDSRLGKAINELSMETRDQTVELLDELLKDELEKAQKSAGVGAIGVAPGGAVAGTLELQTVTGALSGGNIEGTLYVSGGNVSGGVVTAGQSIVAVPIVAGTGLTTFKEVVFQGANGQEVPTLNIEIDNSESGNTTNTVAGVVNLKNPENLHSAVGDVQVGAAEVRLSRGDLSVSEGIPAEQFEISNGSFLLPIENAQMGEMNKRLAALLLHHSSATRKDALASQEGDEDKYVLTVSVTAKRPSNGATGVTVASIPVTVTQTDDDTTPAGGPHSGCDAGGLGLAAMGLALGALALRPRRR